MAKRRGFTLVELVVVVLILGILAAVAAPKILNDSADAIDNGAMQSLATIRDAIELYRANTGTGYPQGTSAQVQTKLDDYLRGTVFPEPNVAGITSNAILMDADDTPTVNVVGGEGWVYSTSSGEVIINSSSALLSDPATTYDQL